MKCTEAESLITAHNKGLLNPMLTGLDGKRNTLSLCEATKTQGSFVIASILSLDNCTARHLSLIVLWAGLASFCSEKDKASRESSNFLLLHPSIVYVSSNFLFPSHHPQQWNHPLGCFILSPLSVLYLCSVNCSLPLKNTFNSPFL